MTKPAPHYANNCMARKIDKKFWEIAEKYMENGIIPLKFMKRFLDDLFLIFVGSILELHAFFEDINKIHPTIKFTMAYTTPASEWNKPLVVTAPKKMPYYSWTL